jgi:hypothetical protein
MASRRARWLNPTRRRGYDGLGWPSDVSM